MILDLKITPYKAKVLYSEYKDIIDRKKNVIEFILKSDLLRLSKEFPDLPLQDILKASLDTFSGVSLFYNKSNQYIQNYLDGIGTIADCDDLCRDSNLLTLQNELIKYPFSNSYIMNYIYFSIVNNRSLKEKYLGNEMKREIEKSISLMKGNEADKIVTILQSKLSEIGSIVKTLNNSDMSVGLNEISIKADLVKDDLIIHKEMQLAISNKIKSLEENIDSSLEGMKEAIHDIEIANSENIHSVDQVLSKVDMRLNEMQLASRGIEQSIKSSNRDIKYEEGLINSKIESLEEVIKSLKSLYQTDINTDTIIQGINELESVLTDTKESVNNQIFSTREIDEKVKSIVNGTKIIKGALDSLNGIMRTDLLDSLIKGKSSVLQIDKDVTALTNKYSQIKGGN